MSIEYDEELTELELLNELLEEQLNEQEELCDVLEELRRSPAIPWKR